MPGLRDLPKKKGFRHITLCTVRHKQESQDKEKERESEKETISPDAKSGFIPRTDWRLKEKCCPCLVSSGMHP